MYQLNEREYFSIWRKRKRVTLKEVAKYINCSQSLISRWECDLLDMADEKVRLYREFIKNYEK